MLVPTTLTSVFMAILLGAISQNHKPLCWVAKPMASLGFLLVALQAPTTFGTLYGRTIFAGLILDFLGDVLLINGDDLTFTLGLGSFLLGHVAYIVAFYQTGVTWTWFLLAMLPLTAFAVVVRNALWPTVPGDMKLPVLLYIIVITVMVASAVGSVPYSRHPRMQLLGVTLFFISDLLVAKEKFVDNSFLNPLVGLPLYYAAQHVLARTLY
ncbi:hypothetical protein FRB94_006587 [Tulasnella sp. JGI-2019a]|nr:hypothetical protein FRB93_012072 [Tulasnella sp. JGI-2019a]KAG9012219.1 hypothetical protein FRB94_006587 [Tulasnella sp. JGI-2019a]KAG9036320.1 hypothetical protein FRB95_009242 [Tulasnella sp. JGI-2019a]